MAKEGRSAACKEGGKEEVWQMRRKQPPGAKVLLGEAMERRLGIEVRMARGRGESNKERSVGGKV